MNASIIGHPFIKLVFGRSGCYLENLELDKSFMFEELVLTVNEFLDFKI